MSDAPGTRDAFHTDHDADLLSRAPRKNLFLAATIEAGALKAPVRIRNLSETGAMIDGAALPEVGSTLTLRRMAVEIGAITIWRGSGRCGIKFDGHAHVNDWIAGVRQPHRSDDRNQAGVDAIQAAIRSGSRLPTEERPALDSAITTEDLDTRIAEELAYVARLLEAVGDELADDPIILQRHDRALQNFDSVRQILVQLGVIIGARDRAAAVDAVCLAELRARLLRK